MGEDMETLRLVLSNYPEAVVDQICDDRDWPKNVLIDDDEADIITAGAKFVLSTLKTTFQSGIQAVLGEHVVVTVEIGELKGYVMTISLAEDN